ncbi:opa3 domain containing protein [Grosmannia clavigera kw1407]|uniref:Opa3 domain containing protein n=1 Tax=Grosmannia clavigera (strain kw1407 / UAMH 11150) TaxID=655863 RepID=F0XHD5_GROCL|nr:opa3 domain containing protein [Grosmannia clavigera kw1407]EFX03236.1 opa3 domain containing protein [Grosmannia clavigera kw1407]
MVPLPLFKLAALFVRHISKYGANQIKIQAHEHQRFRRQAARYGQAIHQLNMRLNVAVLRNYDAEKRAREKAEAAEAPTVKTKEQAEREERLKQKEAADRAKYGTTAKEAHPATVIMRTSDASIPAASAAAATATSSTSSSADSTRGPTHFTSVWKRKFRALPEAKAVDLFADVVGAAFILVIASALVLYEYYRSASKPDANLANLERIKDLNGQLTELRAAEDEHVPAEKLHESRILAMEAALRSYRDPKTKQPLLAPAPPPEEDKADLKDTVAEQAAQSAVVA